MGKQRIIGLDTTRLRGKHFAAMSDFLDDEEREELWDNYRRAEAEDERRERVQFERRRRKD